MFQPACLSVNKTVLFVLYHIDPVFTKNCQAIVAPPYCASTRLNQYLRHLRPLGDGKNDSHRRPEQHSELDRHTSASTLQNGRFGLHEKPVRERGSGSHSRLRHSESYRHDRPSPLGLVVRGSSQYVARRRLCSSSSSSLSPSSSSASRSSSSIPDCSTDAEASAPASLSSSVSTVPTNDDEPCCGCWSSLAAAATPRTDDAAASTTARLPTTART